MALLPLSRCIVITWVAPLKTTKDYPMDIHNIARVPAFTTKDGSEIRELLAHRNSCIAKQSLAEARLPPGGITTPHYHPQTEEIYYILEGTAQMQIGDELRP